jgi:hypothetical protein
VADPLYLSLWFADFDREEMLPKALSVMRQFPFSSQPPGVTGVALHPVSWNEATILERRFRPGITPEAAVLIASDLLHDDYAYVFDAAWDLWILDEQQREWVMKPSPVKFVVHGLDFDDAVKRDTSRWILAWTRRSCRSKCNSPLKPRNGCEPMSRS